MELNVSDLESGEIVNIAKEKIGKKMFKLTIENANYPLIITKIHSPSISFEVWNKFATVNENKPIEIEIYMYHAKLFIRDYLNESDLVFPTLENILEKYSFSISEFDEQETGFTKDLLKEEKTAKSIEEFGNYYRYLIKTNETTLLFNKKYRFKDLELSEYKFVMKFIQFLRDIAIREIESDEKLQKKLSEYIENKEKQEKELEEYMQKVKENERKKIELDKMFNDPKPKNSNNYNIRW